MTVPTSRSARVAGHRPTAVRPRAALEPAAPRAAAPTTEQGYALPSMSWWSALLEEETPELRWPASIKVYDAMRSQDAQTQSVLRAVTMPVRRTRWYIDQNGARDEVVQMVAEDLGLPIGVGVPAGGGAAPVPRSRDRFSWSQHLQQALLCLAFGHSVFEQVYRLDEQERLRLRKLAFRPQKTLSKFNVAADGGLVSIEQAPPASARKAAPVVLGVERLVVYTNEREGAEWRGRSLLRAAYKHWLIKDRLIRTQAQMIDRNGMGVPLYKAAGNGQDELDSGRKLASAWRSGLTSGASVPNGADILLRGVEGELPDAMPPIKYHDEQIGRSVLAHFLNLDAQGGSYALAKVQADTFVQSLQALAQEVADTTNQHVVEDLVDLTWGPDEPVPLLRFDEIGAGSGAAIEALKWLIGAGVIFPDRELEEFVRSAVGLPPKPPAGGSTTTT